MGLHRAAALEGAPPTPPCSVTLHFFHGWGMVEIWKIELLIFLCESCLGDWWPDLGLWAEQWNIKHWENVGCWNHWPGPQLVSPPQQLAQHWHACLPCRWSGRKMGQEGGRYQPLWSLRLVFLNCIFLVLTQCMHQKKMYYRIDKTSIHRFWSNY